MPSAFRVVAAGADTAGETAEGSEVSPEEDCRRRELLNIQIYTANQINYVVETLCEHNLQIQWPY